MLVLSLAPDNKLDRLNSDKNVGYSQQFTIKNPSLGHQISNMLKENPNIIVADQITTSTIPEQD